MEEAKEKSLAKFQLEGLIDMLNNAKKDIENIKSFRWFVETVYEDYKEQKGLYKKCLNELLNIKNLNDEDYIRAALDICNYYYDCSIGKIYNSTVYNNDYRKKHYKQLNVDIPISLMEDFENCLKMTKQTKKEFIMKSINDFINNLKKPK